MKWPGEINEPSHNVILIPQLREKNLRLFMGSGLQQ